MPQRRCARCKGTYDEEFFARTRRVSAIANTRSDRRPVCIGCEQTIRDEKKRARRSLVKAHNAIRTHADRWNKKHPDEPLTKAEFAERFDWPADQLAHDIDHEYENGCRRCRRSYKSMGNGLSDITLDIIDPQKLPYYRTNVRWICKTCNSAKSDATPDEDGRRLEAWRMWEQTQQQEPCSFCGERENKHGCLFHEAGGDAA